jgi:AhpD family alkylhydroperoxidase
MVPNAFKLSSCSPELTELRTAFLGFYMQHKTIGFKLTAFIRLLVSDIHVCKYCIDTNTGILLQTGVSMEEIQLARQNPNNAPLDEKDKKMLLLVLKIVKDSNSISAEDLDIVRNAGWTDAEIFEASFHGTSQVASDILLNAFKVESDKF